MGCAKEDDARRQRLSSVDQRGAYEPAPGVPFGSGAVLVPGETSRLARVEGLPHPSRSRITLHPLAEVQVTRLSQTRRKHSLAKDRRIWMRRTPLPIRTCWDVGRRKHDDYSCRPRCSILSRADSLSRPGSWQG